MALGIDYGRSALAYALWAADGDQPELAEAAAMAQVCGSEGYVFAAAENIQVHGGIGFTWEHPAHLYFRRAKSSALMFGDADHHRELLISAVTELSY
jgi:alkylation response protein AidB-like acyl-CoA dehydrogenase